MSYIVYIALQSSEYKRILKQAAHDNDRSLSYYVHSLIEQEVMRLERIDQQNSQSVKEKK